jgi:hypothetical protein
VPLGLQGQAVFKILVSSHCMSLQNITSTHIIQHLDCSNQHKTQCDARGSNDTAFKRDIHACHISRNSAVSTSGADQAILIKYPLPKTAQDSSPMPNILQKVSEQGQGLQL